MKACIPYSGDAIRDGRGRGVQVAVGGLGVASRGVDVGSGFSSLDVEVGRSVAVGGLDFVGSTVAAWVCIVGEEDRVGVSIGEEMGIGVHSP
ncbi:MAG: hypothetical protein U9Q78_05260 [Chloroflexota bacterium]|nr:hypothetical protein [Chloroflexota bacterium]